MDDSKNIKSQVSIIVPVYNEKKILSQNYMNWYKLSQVTELIFVDGGSTDKSTEIEEKLGKTIKCRKMRSLQMNKGAHLASDSVLLFIHANTKINPEVLPVILKNIKKEQVIAGCFSIFLANPNVIYCIIDYLGTLRARSTRIFYGDQGLFIEKERFLNLGDFPEVPIMEDVLFSAKLKRLGKTIVLSNKIWISPRRWEHRGIVSTIITYLYLSTLFYLGFSLTRIRKIYEDLR